MTKKHTGCSDGLDMYGVSRLSNLWLTYDCIEIRGPNVWKIMPANLAYLVLTLKTCKENRCSVSPCAANPIQWDAYITLVSKWKWWGWMARIERIPNDKTCHIVWPIALASWTWILFPELARPSDGRTHFKRPTYQQHALSRAVGVE